MTLEATEGERTYYYWAEDQVIQGVRVAMVPVSEKFDTREAAETIREPIQALHPEAWLSRATDLI